MACVVSYNLYKMLYPQKLLPHSSKENGATPIYDSRWSLNQRFGTKDLRDKDPRNKRRGKMDGKGIIKDSNLTDWGLMDKEQASRFIKIHGKNSANFSSTKISHPDVCLLLHRLRWPGRVRILLLILQEKSGSQPKSMNLTMNFRNGSPHELWQEDSIASPWVGFCHGAHSPPFRIIPDLKICFLARKRVLLKHKKSVQTLP